MREGNTPDTVTHPPVIPTRNQQGMSEAEVNALIDHRLREYDAARQSGHRVIDMRQKVMTYGVGGVVGTVIGAGSVLLVQKLRKKSGGHKP